MNTIQPMTVNFDSQVKGTYDMISQELNPIIVIVPKEILFHASDWIISLWSCV